MDAALNEDERNMLSTAYRKAIDVHRSSSRVVSTRLNEPGATEAQKKIVKDLLKKVELKLEETGREILVSSINVGFNHKFFFL